ncbi:MAG: methyltransferase MtaB domain-containing protein [Roseiarcus sp.]|jgi:methanol--5-hydroxybenzimidazolylcobamide Co-methyltransferase|uniref:methyltransferase MtaB domain-containing protein n=1 Tax=Roseiarcus sp. TaxID=1969460 RepID=UPI003C29B7E0
MTAAFAPLSYSHLAVRSADELIFGVAPKPVRCGLGLEIGAGKVYPEVNFTLPTMDMTDETWPDVCAHYEEIGRNVVARAVHLKAPGLVLEFELLPPMTERPEWGAELTGILKKHMKAANEKWGLPCALRVTPTDIREKGKPPLMRRGEPWDQLRRSFELNAAAGADILSIESIGGKEVHDKALMNGDLPGIVLGLGVLAPRDMAWLWAQIRAICDGHPGVVPGGDSACGFANTAMQLAGQKMLPEVLAAVVRAMSTVRALVAFEQGAIGPSKDCAYEGPVMKAIAGVPIAMEGKSAACAHFSPIGNIASAMCDLWSNESVQNVRLLSGNAPEVFTELLEYDCRLMNAASATGQAMALRDLFTLSDEWLSPQAVVLSPAATFEIASALVSEQDPYLRTVAAGQTAVNLLRRGVQVGKLKLGRKEEQWLGRIEKALEELPGSSEELIDQLEPQYGVFYDKKSYALACRE